MQLLNKLRRYRWAVTGRKKIKTIIAQKHKKGEAVKVILGSSDFSLTTGEWINTDIPQFDITNADHWEYIFGNIKVNNLLAEHVLEHLTESQIKSALALARKYLDKKGVFRVAIPDRNNPDTVYQEESKAFGGGSGSDHKVFLNLDDCTALTKAASFHLIPLEYFDAAGRFHYTDFDEANGHVIRSKKNNFKGAKTGFTSLVFDLEIR